jgi:hypothetical protein
MVLISRQSNHPLNASVYSSSQSFSDISAMHEQINYIVVPEGLAADQSGTPLPKPSFVYRQVLDYVITIAEEGDAVYLAPANHYGGKTSEHEAAFEYLEKSKRPGVSCYSPPVKCEKYIDTYGNAHYLKLFLQDAIEYMSFELVCAYIHSYRAAHCFKTQGFNLKKVHRVYYTVAHENIVIRLWYYRFKPIHVVYELGAFMRDIIR